MARLLVYTSPARGHIFPITPALLELRRRGHEVVVRTISDAVDPLRDAGLDAEALPQAIETREIGDWRARTPLGAQKLAFGAFMDRAERELGDAREAIAEHRPDALLLDTHAWGATAVAETSGVPFARFHAFPLPMLADGVPPFGPGLAPMPGSIGRARDRALSRVLFGQLNRIVLPRLNAVRTQAGAPPVDHLAAAYVGQAPLLHLSAEPFEYPRAWPANVHLVGPGLWEPPSGPADDELLRWVDDSGRDLVVVTISSEFQDDTKIVDCALEALAGEDVVVVATTPAADTRPRPAPANARVVRFASHGPLLACASAVVCHAGMGITQKALAHGVPVCAVPFGRDQPEVARRVVVAGAGVRLAPRRLRADRLRAAVTEAMACRAGAEQVAAGFAAAGGAPRAADVVEKLLAPAATGPRTRTGPSGAGRS